MKNKFKLMLKNQKQIQSSSQFKKESIHQKIEQSKLLIDTPIIKVILTNDGVKMNINKEVMISYAKEHKIYNLNRKQEDLSNKVTNNQL